MTEKPKYQNTFTFNQPVGNINAGDTEIKRDQVGIQHNYAPEQNLAEAAAEIQQLLAQLNQTYPATTESEQQQLANRVDEEIRTNARIRDMVLAGGIELIKILCPPLGIPIEMGMKWLETAKKNK